MKYRPLLLLFKGESFLLGCQINCSVLFFIHFSEAKSTSESTIPDCHPDQLTVHRVQVQTTTSGINYSDESSKLAVFACSMGAENVTVKSWSGPNNIWIIS